MKLSQSLAKKIIDEVKKVLDENVIVVGIDGIIMASTDPVRVENFHEGAYIVIQTGEKLEIKKEDVKKLKGVKAGVNLPIRFHNEVIGVIGITGTPKEVGQHGDLLRRMTELLIQENYIREQMDWRERTLETYVFDWIKMKKWSHSMIQRGEILGLNLNVIRRCILIQTKNDTVMEPNLWLVIQRYFEKMEIDNIIVRWGNNRFIVLQESTATFTESRIIYYLEKLLTIVKEQFNINILIGIGSPVSAEFISQSYEEAKRALATTNENKPIVFESELKFEICLQDITNNTKNLYVERTIGKLLEDRELIETLKVFINCNASLKNTAELLHVHINTLHYRLKKIEELTTLNPKRFKDLVTLYFAIMFLDTYTKKYK